ncbi:MAG: N utilization substance protein A, partial [Limisphaerales bacterium]
VRKAEKALIYEEFKDRTGDIVSGVVRRFERSDVVVDLGRYEALLPNRERVPTEEYQPGERIRCYVKAVENTNYGPEIILSRAAPGFVEKLFALEVSEIANGTVQIKSIAREPGFRTKLAVISTDDKVDPVGACVGLRGQRVKNIVRELNNEKMDIIKWDTDIQTYLTNALAPAQLDSFQIDEANKSVKILVAEDQLSLTIGKRGQNARLASRLTGWQVNIDAKQTAAQSVEDKIAEAAQAFAAVPGISVELAQTLVESGFHALEDLTQVEASDLVDIEGIGDEAAAILEAVKQELNKRDNRLLDPSPEDPSPEDPSPEDPSPEDNADA